MSPAEDLVEGLLGPVEPASRAAVNSRNATP